jgi:hypothetical protein
MDSKYIEIEVRVVAEGDKSYLCALDNDQGEQWIPKNQIEDPDQYKVTNNRWVKMYLTRWIIDQMEIEV